MNDPSDLQGSVVEATPEEMSTAADASKVQRQLNLYSLAPQPSLNAGGISLLSASHFIF